VIFFPRNLGWKYKRGRGVVLGMAVLAALRLSFAGSRAQSSQAPTATQELKLATAADQAGDNAAAAQHFQRFIDTVRPADIKPQSLVEIRTRLATLYFLLHDYRASLRAVLPVTTAKLPPAPIPQQAWTVEGLDDHELNQVAEAVKALKKAHKLNPASGTARLALGDALAREGELAAAVDQFNEQLRRTPGEVEAWYKLGLAYAFLTKKTAEDFRARYPENPLAQQLKAEESISNANYAEAIRTLFDVSKVNSSQAGLAADLGMALLNLGFPQTAESQFQKELKTDPHSPDALFGLSVVAALHGDWDNVRGNIRAVAAGNPQELSRLFESAPPIVLRQALQKQLTVPASFAATPEGAAWNNWLHESDVDTSAINPGTPAACREPIAISQHEPGAWLSAICYRTLADQLRQQKAVSKTDKEMMAEAELRQGSPNQAVATARRELASNPSNGWAMYWLVKSYAALGYAAFRKVSTLNPNSPRIHQMMAKYYSDKHETSHAVEEYEAALKLSPDLPDLHLGLGTVYWEAGDWDKAEGPLRRALDLSPGLLSADYELGDVYVQKRQWDDAVRYLRPAKGESTLSYNVCLDLSKAEAGLGRTEEAIDELLPWANQDPDGEIHYRLALLYRKMGETSKAQAAFTTSNQLRQASLQHGQDVLQTMEKEKQALEQADR